MSWTANQGYGTGLTLKTIITGIQPRGIGVVVVRRQVADLDRTTGTAGEWARVGSGMWAGSGSQIRLRVGARNCSRFLPDVACLLSDPENLIPIRPTVTRASVCTLEMMPGRPTTVVPWVHDLQQLSSQKLGPARHSSP